MMFPPSPLPARAAQLPEAIPSHMPFRPAGIVQFFWTFPQLWWLAVSSMRGRNRESLPCEAIGDADFVKAVLGPSPWTKMMLTGLTSIDQESVSKLFAAGIVAFGIGQK